MERQIVIILRYGYRWSHGPHGEPVAGGDGYFLETQDQTGKTTSGLNTHNDQLTCSELVKLLAHFGFNLDGDQIDELRRAGLIPRYPDLPSPRDGVT